MKLPQEVIYLLVVLLGAIVHAIVKYQEARRGKIDYNFLDFITLSIVACFGGLMSGFLSSIFFESTTVISLFAGMGAFLGLEGLSRIGKIIGALQEGLISGLKK